MRGQASDMEIQAREILEDEEVVEWAFGYACGQRPGNC